MPLLCYIQYESFFQASSIPNIHTQSEIVDI